MKPEAAYCIVTVLSFLHKFPENVSGFFVPLWIFYSILFRFGTRFSVYTYTQNNSNEINFRMIAKIFTFSETEHFHSEKLFHFGFIFFFVCCLDDVQSLGLTQPGQKIYSLNLNVNKIKGLDVQPYEYVTSINPFEMEIKCMCTNQHSKLNERCKRNRKVKEKKKIIRSRAAYRPIAHLHQVD